MVDPSVSQEPGSILFPGCALLVLLAALGLLAFGADWVASQIPDHAAGATDYVEYAAAARLLRQGENPYDGSKLLPLQLEAGWGRHESDPSQIRADMMWNPPWVFPIVLPNAWFAWGEGLGLWVLVQVLAVVASVSLFWWNLRGPAKGLPLWLILILLLPPTFFLFRLGQISGFLLLGLVGFLEGHRLRAHVIGGASLTLLAIKPHLLLPVAVLLACDSLVSSTTRRCVLIGAGILGLAALFPLAWNPTVWSQYLEAVKAPTDAYHYAPSDWQPPTLAAQFRDLVGGGLLVQFLPSIVTTLGLVIYWYVKRRDWWWKREMPGVVTLSVLTTGYGAWGFDLVVLLLPLTATAVQVSRSTRPGLLPLGMLAMVGFTLAVLAFGLPVLWWTPTIVAGTWLFMRLSRTDRSPAS